MKNGGTTENSFRSRWHFPGKNKIK
jgi:hypothetical protein